MNQATLIKLREGLGITRLTMAMALEINIHEYIRLEEGEPIESVIHMAITKLAEVSSDPESY